MHVGFHRKARRRQNAFGGFDVSRVETEAFGQFQPALDAALGAWITVMVFDSVPPFHANAAIAKARDHHRILDRDRALVIVAVQRPGLHLSLVELTAVQQPVKGMQAVIARLSDETECGFQFRGAVQHGFAAERKRGHPCKFRRLGTQSVNSVPSAGICHPARITALRSSESCSKAGFELLICRNIFRSMPRFSRAAIAPVSPDIAICPMPRPVLVERPAAISSSSRHTVPSKNTRLAPLSLDLRPSVTSAQAARK